MKRFISGIASGVLMIGATNMTPCAAQAQDTGDYPVFYLRGDGIGGWGENDNNNVFTRIENVYSIHIENLNGQFKITNKDWTINYGGNENRNEIYEIQEPCFVRGGANYSNFSAENLANVDISFTYNPADNSTALISFSIDGVTPKISTGEEYASGALPILYLNFYNSDGSYNNEVIDKDLSHKNYFKGEYWLDINGCDWLEELGAANIGSREEPLPLEMKARGNWTRRGYSKKPFKLKLGAKQSLLGLSKSKHFAILAHADDIYGYMRNFTGFRLGQLIELPWTPWQQPVEVIINGDYRGLYFLTESIRVEKDRVNIQELDDNVTDPELVSGGYLVELDNYDEPEENQIRMEEKGVTWDGNKDLLRITFDTPEEYSDIQRRFVEDQFSAMNDAIGENSDRLWGYMDLDDAARYYVVEEIISHTEAYHGSTYLFRDRGADQKWHFSPLWDCGNAFNGPTDNYFTRTKTWGNTWIASLRENQKFMEKVRETWKWFMGNKFGDFYTELETYSTHLKAAAEADYNRWHDKLVPDYPGATGVVDNRDMDSRLSDVKNKLQSKIEWLGSQWGSFSEDNLEPERDGTEAAPLPDYLTSSVAEISAIENMDDMEIYTLQGIKVTTPLSGNLYIFKYKTHSRKVMVK